MHNDMKEKLTRFRSMLWRHKWLTTLSIIIQFVVGPFIAAGTWQAIEDRKAKMTTDGPYSATEGSLNDHPLPDWFEDAKFGIFIHWGLFSVPGFAPKGDYKELLKKNYDQANLVHPYAEDYWNAMKDPTTPTAKYHKKQYRDMPYSGFKKMFQEGLKDWDPDSWAEKFQDAGAEYVVLVAKYHDGFALWPTGVTTPYQSNWHTERDVVDELAVAVRERGIKFGIYYSGGVDWTFQRDVVRTLGDYNYMNHGSDYADYADAQVRELIRRYKPAILWNDIRWPTGEKRLFSLFADYYNTVSKGVVNDRWQTNSFWHTLMGLSPMRTGFDLLVKTLFTTNPNFIDEIKPPTIPHNDFTTPEYTQYDTLQKEKWEMTRGIGNSFGYNQQETDEDYASFEKTLLPSFVDAVSKNGNLLLNVGPRGGNGVIPEEQMKRLTKFGNWFDKNSAAIYGTRPWKKAEAQTAEGQQVRFTQKDNTVNVIVQGRVSGETIHIENLQLSGNARLLADDSNVTLEQAGDDLVLTFQQPLDNVFTPAIAITQ